MSKPSIVQQKAAQHDRQVNARPYLDDLTDDERTAAIAEGHDPDALCAVTLGLVQLDALGASNQGHLAIQAQLATPAPVLRKVSAVLDAKGNTTAMDGAHVIIPPVRVLISRRVLREAEKPSPDDESSPSGVAQPSGT